MTLSCENWLVQWAYLFHKGIPNETTRKDFFWRVLVQVPGTILAVVTVLGLLGLFIWRHPWTALLIPYITVMLGAIISFVIRVDQVGDVEMNGYLRNKYKIYFQ